MFLLISGIIFVIDSSDRERITEAKVELYKLLKEDDLKNAILMIYANKQDISSSMSTTEISDKLGLLKLRNRTWYIQATSALRGDGLYQGLDWMSQQIKNRGKKKAKAKYT